MHEDVLSAAPPTGVRFEKGTTNADLIKALAEPFYQLDIDIGDLKEGRYLESATGRELERRAKPVGVKRKTNENDDSFRLRALGGRKSATSGATYTDFAEAVLAVLDASPSEVELKVDYTDELGAVIVKASSTIFDDSPFTTTEIESQLEEAIPSDRRVVLRETDSFQFSDPSTTSSKEGLGWGQGQWTS